MPEITVRKRHSWWWVTRGASRGVPFRTWREAYDYAASLAPLAPLVGLMADAWNARSYKKPGMTLAESLGIQVPDNAPGGQRIAPPVPRARVSAQNAVNARYDGFHDLDAYGRCS